MYPRPTTLKVRLRNVKETKEEKNFPTRRAILHNRKPSILNRSESAAKTDGTTAISREAAVVGRPPEVGGSATAKRRE